MDGWSIGEVGRRAGLRTSAIRYYESVGLLPRPQRARGRRVYDASVLERLAVVELARRAGFTIAETKTLLHGFSRKTPPSARWRQLTARKIEEIDARIVEAQQMRQVLEILRTCQCPTLEECGRALRDVRDG